MYHNFGGNYANSEYLLNEQSCQQQNKIKEKKFNLTKQLPGKITISESIYDCIEDKHKAVYDSDILNRINS